MPKKVEIIPATKEKKVIPVGIYCRVSSNSVEQLRSLSAQASALTKYVYYIDEWRLADTYLEVVSAKTGSRRPEFSRLLDDCKSERIELVIVKNVSRFGRDTVEIQASVQQLRETGARILFYEEKLDTKRVGDDVLLSVIGAVAQAENETRGENIRMGMRFRAADGSLGLYKRKCYGYYNDENGNLAIDEVQAEIVRLIYSLYLQGNSVLGIIKELEKRSIPSPKGKPKWNKSKVDEILKNEKYIGEVHVLKSNSGKESYLASDAHPAILTKGVYYAAQDERKRRTNIVKTADGTKRKSTKYSSKKITEERLEKEEK